MKVKRYDKRIVQAKGGYRLKLYFKSDDGYRVALASPILLRENIKSEKIEDWGFEYSFAPSYTEEFKSEMDKFAKRIADIKELGK